MSTDRTTNLLVAGDTVTVTVTGIPVETGIYVRLCKGTAAEAALARPSECFGMGSWVSLSASQQRFGAGNPNNPIALAVKGEFDAVNCVTGSCGIHIRRDHLGGAIDYSLDSFIPVAFVQPVVVAPVAKSNITFSKNRVTFAVVGQVGKNVTFVVSGKKFVRKATSDNFKVTFTTKAKGTYSASIFQGSKKLLWKRTAK